MEAKSGKVNLFEFKSSLFYVLRLCLKGQPIQKQNKTERNKLKEIVKQRHEVEMVWRMEEGLGSIGGRVGYDYDQYKLNMLMKLSKNYFKNYILNSNTFLSQAYTLVPSCHTILRMSRN